MERRKIIGAAVFSAAIAGGGVAGVVLGTPASSSAATAGSTTTVKPGDGVGKGVHGRGIGLDAAAKAIGISTDDLREQLEDGKSIAEVAKAKGVAVQKVIDAMVAAASADFDANIEERVTDRVNGTFERPDRPGGPGGPHRGFAFRGGFGLDAAAKAIGVSTDDLREQLKDGKSIAEVAKAKGVSAQKVIDAMVAAANAEFAEQVKAGRLTEEQAKRLEANLTSMITDQVNGTFKRPALNSGGGRGHRGSFGSGPEAPVAPDSTSSGASLNA